MDDALRAAKLVLEGVEHEADQQEDADLLRDLPAADTDWPTHHGLQCKEGQVAAVEDGDREQVQDTQVDTEDSDQENII